MNAARLSVWQEIQLWWALHGELQSDLVTYYAVCSAYGAWSGWVVGRAILGLPLY